MTSSDDYPFDMSEPIPQQRDGLDEASIQSLLGASSRARSGQFAELAGVLTELRAVVELPAPAPSPELAEMLRVGLTPSAQSGAELTEPAPRSRGRLRRALVAVAITSLAGAPVMGVAAAQDRLPDVAQHVVATVIKAATPFTVSDPTVETSDTERGQQTSPNSRKTRRGGSAPVVVVQNGVPSVTATVDPALADPAVDGTETGEDPAAVPTPDGANAEVPGAEGTNPGGTTTGGPTTGSTDGGGTTTGSTNPGSTTTGSTTTGSTNGGGTIAGGTDVAPDVRAPGAADGQTAPSARPTPKSPSVAPVPTPAATGSGPAAQPAPEPVPSAVVVPPIPTSGGAAVGDVGSAPGAGRASPPNLRTHPSQAATPDVPHSRGRLAGSQQSEPTSEPSTPV